nr:uncharacterized protein LOC109189671 [Ipomoea trifida]
MEGKEEAKEHKTYQWNTKEKTDGANGRRRGVRERKEKWKMKGSKVRVEFRYEQLPTFFFVCGVLGHGDKFCPKVVQGWDPQLEKPYGSTLHVGN